MAIKTRPDLMPYETGINTTLLSKASKIVSNATGFPVQYNKAIVGKNAFAHEGRVSIKMVCLKIDKLMKL
jgi:2-isopropylmalate synthase